MSGTGEALVAAPSPIKGTGRASKLRSMRAIETRWAIAFVAPYAAVFVAFVIYPVAYAVWLGGRPSLFVELVSNPLYLPTVVNTLFFVGIGVNVTMLAALLLSGFFLRPRWWIRLLLLPFLLPWLIATVQACVSFHWMLIDQRGLIDGLLSALFDIDGPLWFNHRWLATGANIVAFTWKWLPFWTVIFIAGRMTIPRDVYDAAAVDGAIGLRRFVHVTFPLLANLYLICALLMTLWALGDFTTVYLVSGGAPSLSSEVLATLGFHYAFDTAKPALGVAAVLTSLPVLIPIAIILMRRLQIREVQL